MLHYALLILIISSSFYSLPWILPTIAAIMIMLSLFFYWMNVSLISGVMVSKLNDELDVPSAWIKGIIRIGAVGILAITGDVYIIAAAFVAPWVLMSTYCDTLATLAKWEIIQITDRDE